MNTHVWIEALGWTLIHSLWQGTLVAVLLRLVLRTSRRSQPQFRYAAGCAALLLLVFVSAATWMRETSSVRFSPSVVSPGITSHALPVRHVGPTTPFEVRTPLPTATPQDFTAFASETVSLPPVPAIWPSLTSRVQMFLPWIVFTWSAGVLFCFLRLCHGWNTVQKLRRSGNPLDPETWSASLNRLAKQLQISRPVRLVATAAVRVPMVIGWIKPVVLLPCRLVTGLPQEQVEAIVAHEFAHIRRHDYLVNLLQNVIEILFFFHPALWWISARIREERELCCDDLATVAIGGALPYVKALTALEEARGVAENLAVAITGHSLLSRARRLLKPSPAEGPGSTTLVGVCALLIVVATMALPFALGQNPKQESTSPSSKPSADPSGSSRQNLHAEAGFGKHEQTRKLLQLWKAEFRSKQMFAVATNTRVQRKPGSKVREPREVTFEELQALEIPAEAFNRLARYVEKSIDRFPGENDVKLRALLPRIQANQRRTLPEAANLIDQICDLSQKPVTQLAIDEQFRAFGRLKPGEPLPAALLDQLPFGPASANGLRAAWTFRPMKEDYALGDALASRIIIHNAGKDPVEFVSDAWHQDDDWFVTNAADAAVQPKKIPFRHSEDVNRSRLAPGEAVELRGPALGIGLGEFDEIYGDRIGMKLPARVGDEFRLHWTIKLQAAWAQSDDPSAATPTPLKLTTGPVKLRIVARDPIGPKPVFIATTPGKYILGPGTNLRIDRVRLQGFGTINGVRDESKSKISENNWAHLEVAENRSKSISVQLPQGDDSYVIAWERGAGVIWIGEAESVRKLEISTVGRFPAAEVLASIDPSQREEVAAFLDNAGTGVPEKRWKWEDPDDFGGIPADVKAALIQHRPKADSKAAAPEPTFPVNGTDPRLPWSASGRVTDVHGKPMRDVEIWIHAGMGSLKRTGFAKTDADGRYTANFGPGVLMEEGSTQLQIANITAHLPGFFEKNLSRHGQGAAAMRDVSAESLKDYGVTVDQLTLPKNPRQLDFVMLRGATIKGRLVGTGRFPAFPPRDYRNNRDEKPIAGHVQHNHAPLARWQVWLTGKQLPPGSGVFASAETDHEGRFEFRDVPAGFAWQLQADTHLSGKDPRSPEFKVGSAGEMQLEVELDEKQTALKFVPLPRKKPGTGAAMNWRVQVVEGETGNPIPNALVKFVRLAGIDNFPAEETRTDATGFAQLHLAPKSLAILEVIAPDRWAPGALTVGELANGSNSAQTSDPATPKVIALWKGTNIRGRLLQPDNSPLPNAPLNVSVYVDNEEWMKRAGLDTSRKSSDRGDRQNWAIIVKTTADGSFETTVPPPVARNWVRVNTMEIAFGVTAPPATKAALEKCAPFMAEDRAREGQSAERDGRLNFGDLRLMRGLVLRGRVEDTEGRTLPGIGLTLAGMHGSFGGRSTRSDANGRFQFLPVSSGTITVTADSRFSQDGFIPPRDVPRVFATEQVTFPKGAESTDIVVRAAAHKTVEFEWVDRRKAKGRPVSQSGGFSITGKIPVKGGEPTFWRGTSEKVARDGKNYLIIHLPADITEPSLTLPADSLVTPSYEDDQQKLGPGTHNLQDLLTPKRRVIYGDDPQSNR